MDTQPQDSGARSVGGGSTGTGPRRLHTWPLAWLWRALRLVLVLLAGLLLGVTVFVLSLPADLVRRAGVGIAREVLHHPNLEIEALEISPLRGLELRGLWLGPPAGYRWPLFTLKRVHAAWDLGGLLRGELRLRVLQVERPLVRVEQRNGKLSWLAFLEGLPKSEPKPEEKSEPPDLRIWIDRVAVVGVGLLFDDGKQRLLLDGLQVGAAGLYSKRRTHLDATVRLEERRPGRPNLAVLVPGAPGQPRLGGRFRLGLGLEASVEGLEKPQADLQLRTTLGSTEIRAPWKLAPITLELALAAGADLGKNSARLGELRVGFNGTELLRVSAGVKGLAPPRDFEVHLANLRVPLDLLAPYIQAVVPSLEVGGDLLVRDLAPSGDLQSVQRLLAVLQQPSGPLPLPRLLDELRQRVPPRISGLIEARKLRARMTPPRGAPVEVRDIDLEVTFASSSRTAGEPAPPEAIAAALPPLTAAPLALPGQQPAPGTPPLLLQTRLRVGSVRAAGAEVRGLDLRLATGFGLKGAEPRSFASHLSVALPSVRYRHPKLGAVELGLQTRLRAHGDLRRERFTLERLELALGDWLRTRLSARLQGFDRKAFEADLVVEPFRVERVIARLPAPIRTSLGRLRVLGSIGLQSKVKGRVPAPRTPPLKLPIELDTRLSLEDLRVEDPDRQLFVEKLGGGLRVQGKPSDLRVTSDLRIGALRKPDQRLSLKDLALPLSLLVSPGEVEASLGVRLGSVRHEALGLAGHKTTVDVELKAALPLERVIEGKPFAPGSISLRVKAGATDLRLAQTGNTLGVRGLRTGLDLSYQPQRKELTVVKLELGASSVRHAEQGATLDDLSVKVRTGLQGPPLKVPLPFAAGELTARGLLEHLKQVQTGLEVRVGRIGLRGVLDQPLRSNRVALELGVGADQKLELRKLSLQVPGRGLTVEASGSVGEILSAGLGPLPPFDLQLKTTLDNPVTHDSRRALLIAPNLKVAGRVGLALRLRRIAAGRVQVDGALHSRRFNLWTRSIAVEPQGTNQLRRTQLLHVMDMDTEIPLTQQLIIKPPRFDLPPPRRSIFEGSTASALYSSLQPYTGKRSKLRIGGITLDEQITATSREGYFLSTVNRRTKVDRLALDVGIADSTLELSRLYVKVFGGDVAGEVQAQLVKLRPLDVRLRLRTQVTGVNLAYLDPAAKERTGKTEVSALVDLKYWLSRQLVEGRVDITRLSLDMLDALLAYLDPNKTNESVQSNRKLLNAWYTKWVNPKVKLVSVWINHGNLNMDIDMDAWFVAGTILKRTLKNMRIRRINILPFLPKGAATEEE